MGVSLLPRLELGYFSILAAVISSCLAPSPTEEPQQELDGESGVEVGSDTGRAVHGRAIEGHLAGLPCAQQRECAAVDGQTIEGTCCVAGDPIRRAATLQALELVDIEVQDHLIAACGGFGVTVARIDDRGQLNRIAQLAGRCENAAFADPGPDGHRRLYVSHHGDTWVPEPFVATIVITPDDHAELIARTPAFSPLFAGLAVYGSFLYTATHNSGVQLYTLNDEGIPQHALGIAGFDGAFELEVVNDRLFVLERASRLQILSLAQPTKPEAIQVLPLRAPPRDLAIDAARIYVALGSHGLEVFEAGSDGLYQSVDYVASPGATVAVAADAGRVALANWDHLSLLDGHTLHRLGSQRLRPPDQLEQHFGIELRGLDIYAAEWQGIERLRYHPGHAAAIPWVKPRQYQFDGEEASSAVVLIENRGALPMQIEGLVDTSDAFTMDVEPTELDPGDKVAYELAFQPALEPESNRAVLQLQTDLPDDDMHATQLLADATASSRLREGDSLDRSFAFLDPGGQLERLRGHVTVLSYFSLF